MRIERPNIILIMTDQQRYDTIGALRNPWMLLDMAQVETPGFNRAISPLPMITDDAPGSEAVYAERSVTVHLREISFETMIRTVDWKLVHYLDRDYGDLYDLRNDPGELRNVWGNLDYMKIKRDLLDKIRDWRIRLPDPMAERMRHIAVT